jgi:hypothetical protein
MTRGIGPVRALGIAQITAGAAMVIAPRFLSGLTGGPVAPTPVVRILGARNIGQGLVTATRADAIALTVGAAVDIAHLASMVVLAAVRPRWRRTAGGSAAIAAASAGAGLALARSTAHR